MLGYAQQAGCWHRRRFKVEGDRNWSGQRNGSTAAKTNRMGARLARLVERGDICPGKESRPGLIRRCWKYLLHPPQGQVVCTILVAA